MPEFHVTFGGQYGSPEYGADPHPRLAIAHRDGYLTVVADDEDRARQLAVAVLGTAWSFIYSAEKHKSEEHFYPLGELLRVTDPTMTQPVALLAGKAESPIVLVSVYADGHATIKDRENTGQSWGPPRPLETRPTA